MLDGQSLDAAVLGENVHGAPIGKRRHDETGDARKRRLVVQRRCQDGACFGEQSGAPLRGLRFGARSLLGAQALRRVLRSFALRDIDTESDNAFERRIGVIPIGGVPHDCPQCSIFRGNHELVVGDVA